MFNSLKEGLLAFLGFLASSGILVGFNPLKRCYLTEPENWLLDKPTVHGMYNTRQQEVFKAIKILPAEELSDLLTFSFTTFRRSASSCVTDADGCKRMIIHFCHFPSNFIHWNTFLAGWGGNCSGICQCRSTRGGRCGSSPSRALDSWQQPLEPVSQSSTICNLSKDVKSPGWWSCTSPPWPPANHCRPRKAPPSEK